MLMVGDAAVVAVVVVVDVLLEEAISRTSWTRGVMVVLNVRTSTKDTDD